MKFETQLFITAGEARPAIWDSRPVSYSGKVETTNAIKYGVKYTTFPP
jgi:hypothetical protein